MPLLRIDAVVKKFGGFRAVDRLSLDIRAGEFFALLGPSGCGKTTLLRMLAGFETPDEGRILLDGKDIAQVLPHQRPVNMMFQNYALFPHLTVRDNIAFGLKRAGMPRRRDRYPRRRDGRAGQARGPREAQARSALRRPEAARGAGALAGAPSAGAAARRAAGRARQEAARKHPARIDGIAAAARPDLHHRHPRSGRGDDGGRPDRRDGCRPSRTGRDAARALRGAAFALGRRVRRRHQFVRGPGRSSARAARLAIATRDAGTIYRRRAAPAGHQDQSSASRSAPKRSSCRAAARRRTRSTRMRSTGSKGS